MQADALISKTLLDGTYVLSESYDGAPRAAIAARHLPSGRPVLVRIGRAPEQGAVERFLANAARASQVKHPTLASLEAFGQLDARACFLVFEQIAGERLDRWADTVGIPPLDIVVALMSQACTALALVHDGGISHERVTPASFLVLPGAGPGLQASALALADVGVPAFMRRDPIEVEEARFLAPELLARTIGARTAPLSEARAQVYSMGCLLYYLCTGGAPFQSRSLRELVLAHGARKLVPPSRINPQIPLYLDTLITRALSIEPEGRYASVSELAAALSPVRGSGSVSGVRPRTSVPPRPGAATREPSMPPSAAVWPSAETFAEPRAQSPVPEVPPMPATRSSVPPPIGSFSSAPPPAAGEAAVARERARAPGKRAARPSRALAWAAAGLVAFAVIFGLLRSVPEEPPPPRERGAATTSTKREPSTAITSTAPQPENEAEERIPWGGTTALATPTEEASPREESPRRASPRSQRSDGSDPSPARGAVRAQSEAASVVTVLPAREPPLPDPTSSPGGGAFARQTPSTREPPSTVPTPSAAALPQSSEPESIQPPPTAANAETPRKAEGDPTRPSLPLTATARIGELRVRGSLATGVVRRAIERVRPRFVECYARAAGAARRNAHGTLWASVEIDERGRARAAQARGGALPGLDACVGRAAGQLVSEQRPDTGTVKAEWEVVFAP